MKALKYLTNADKAILLHQLFPEEIPALLEFIKNMSISLIKEQVHHRKSWDNNLFSFDQWLLLVGQTVGIIDGYGKKLHRRHRLFSDQLFDGYIACYTNHCVTVFATTTEHRNRKFIQAIQLLFNVQ